MTALAPIRYLSVCAGIEAATAAWHPLGWQPVAFSEIEAYPRRVLEQRHGARDARLSGSAEGVPLWGDFTTMRPSAFRRLGLDPTIDLIVGGTPCQDFSVAGKRAGLDGARGHLTREYAALARRFGSEWMVWENVPGAFSLNGGRDFGTVLACFAGYPEGSAFEPPKDGWQNFGVVPPAGPDCYGLAWAVLDAQYFGVPQRRARIIVVGYLGDWRPAAAVLLERESLSRNPPPCREAGTGVAAITSHGVGTCGADDNQVQAGHLIPQVAGAICRDSFTGGAGGKPEGAAAGHYIPQVFGGNNTSGPINVAPALNAHGGGSRRIDFESVAFVATTLRSRAGARGVDSDCTDTLIAHTLRAEGHDASEDGTGRGVPLVITAFDTTQITSPGNYSSPGAGEPCHPLAAKAHAPAIAFDCKASSSFQPAPSIEQSPTLRSMSSHKTGANAGEQVAVAISLRGREGGATAEISGDVMPALRCGGGGGDKPHALTETAVRRLTPRECDRLQGFPDDYSRAVMTRTRLAEKPRDKWLRKRGEIVRPASGMVVADQWRVVDADEALYLAAAGYRVEQRANGNWYTTAAADGPCYKTLGNSMAGPVMAWIGRRIDIVRQILAEQQKSEAAE